MKKKKAITKHSTLKRKIMVYHQAQCIMCGQYTHSTPEMQEKTRRKSAKEIEWLDDWVFQKKAGWTCHICSAEYKPQGEA